MTNPRAGTARGAAAAPPGSGPSSRSPDHADGASPGVDAVLLDLIRRPYLAEILAALDQRPHTLATLRHTTGARRNQAVGVLRALASHHAITRQPVTGSWDAAGDKRVQYRLTATGHDLIGRLFDVRPWAALYQDHGSTAASDPD